MTMNNYTINLFVEIVVLIRTF